MENRISEIRKKKGITQEKLSETVAIARGYLSEIENGGRNPSVEVALKISEALGVKVDQIFLLQQSHIVDTKILKPLENK